MLCDLWINLPAQNKIESLRQIAGADEIMDIPTLTARLLIRALGEMMAEYRRGTSS